MLHTGLVQHGRLFGLALVAFALSAVLWVGVGVCFEAYHVPSLVMDPAITSGDRVIVRTVGVDVGRGDVVIVEDPVDGPPARISRVVGVGGERIEARGGRVLIDGKPQDEAYLQGSVQTGEFPPTDVPDGSVFLLGDNRANSRDSRMLGPIDVDDVIGTVSFVNVPIDRIATFLTAGLGLLVLAIVLRHPRVQARRGRPSPAAG